VLSETKKINKMEALAWKSLWERWSEWLRKEEKKNVVNNGEKPTRTTQRLKSFLNRRFDFRYNRLTGVTEYREKEAVGFPFRPIDEREMNGLIVDARLAGIPCWNSLIPTLVLSNKVESFNPFHLYLSELPAWDGIDRVTPLLRRVSDNELWLRGGRYWLRSLTAQWMGTERSHANSLMPVLISNEQGLGKSTFCRQLLPDSLRMYYLDNLNLSPGTSPEKKLVTKGLINLDEFDKIGEKRQPDLKNLLQMLSVPVYRGKRLGYVTEPRLASFIGTTNSRQILCDVSGSRRFLCVEVKQYISDEPLEHKQLYAQLKQELANGERDYLNREEERELQRSNQRFYRQSLLEDVFFACFRLPEGNEEGRWMTAAEMFRVMSKKNPAALRGITAKQLSHRLSGWGFQYKHTNHGNYYLAVCQ
jgi:hypothetical protein